MIGTPEDRAVVLGEMITNSGCTVRAAAKRFGVSKSTVHKDVTERLRKVEPGLWAEVKKVLETNKAERHMRGGEATRQKYIRAADRRTGAAGKDAVK